MGRPPWTNEWLYTDGDKEYLSRGRPPSISLGHQKTFPLLWKSLFFAIVLISKHIPHQKLLNLQGDERNLQLLGMDLSTHFNRTGNFIWWHDMRRSGPIVDSEFTFKFNSIRRRFFIALLSNMFTSVQFKRYQSCSRGEWTKEEQNTSGRERNSTLTTMIEIADDEWLTGFSLPLNSIQFFSFPPSQEKLAVSSSAGPS